jgi:hypothetical protein
MTITVKELIEDLNKMLEDRSIGENFEVAVDEDNIYSDESIKIIEIIPNPRNGEVVLFYKGDLNSKKCKVERFKNNFRVYLKNRIQTLDRIWESDRVHYAKDKIDLLSEILWEIDSGEFDDE